MPRLAPFFAALSLAYCLFGVVDAQAPNARRRPRWVSGAAPPPKWTEAERAVFFENAGNQLGPPPDESSVASTASGEDASTSEPLPATGFAWSKLVSAEVLEDEVQNVAEALVPSVANAAAFKASGFKDARRDLSTAAAAFGILGSYDAEARWKAQGASWRDALAQAGRNCKVATDGAFAEVRRRRDALDELIRGGVVDLPDAEADVAWSEVVERVPLMQRMEIARTERLKAWSGTQGEFSAHQAEMVHESELLAALCEVLKAPGYDFAEDGTYQEYLATAQQASMDLAEAARKGELARVQKAVGALSQSCDECHAGFR